MKEIIIGLLVIANFSINAKFMSSEELINKYPSISENSERIENKKILCPFWRLIERSGALDIYKSLISSDLRISSLALLNKAVEFGCARIQCGAVISLVTAGQLTHFGITSPLKTNITRLDKARGVAHDCGLTFEKGGIEVSDKQRSKTLAMLKNIADSNSPSGLLFEKDLMSVKLKICKEQNVKITTAGSIEVGLIFSFLGGKDRGFVEYLDVVKFLNAEMPRTKSINEI